ncbi:MAG: hypothetical protein LBW85_07980 [Deltaproteobacteria bacterium]|nr:hypothetical protein [Deltaproteobacteria bacterium]
MFNFGPYSDMYSGMYHPARDGVMLLCGLLIAVAYFLNLAALKEGSGRKYWILIFLVPVLGFVCPDTIFFTLIALIAVNFYRRLVKGENVAKLQAAVSVAALGLISLSKGTFVYTAAYFIMLLAVLSALKRRLRLMLAIIAGCALSMLVFWLLAGQDMANLPRFFYYIYLVGMNYTEAMTSFTNIYLELLFMLVAAFFTLTLLLEADMKPADRLFGIFIYGPILFMLFKSGFVRDDLGHNIIAYSGLLVVSSFLPFVFKFRSFNILWFAGAMVLYAVANLIALSVYMQVPILPKTFSSLQGIAVRLSDPGRYKTEFDRALASYRRDYALPGLQGTSDVYSWDITYLLSSPNSWNPRPVFVSFNVWHARLAELNREHLLDPKKAPDNVFFAVQTLDMRYPTMDDGPSLPVLINSYELNGEYGRHLIFRRGVARGKSAREGRLLATSSRRFDEKVDVSSFERPLYVTFDIKRSFPGNIANFLFKTSPVFIKVDLRDGTSQVFRINPGVGKAGFLLSPLISNNANLKAVIKSKDGPFPTKVESFTVFLVIDFMRGYTLSKFTGYLWNPTYTVSLYEL